MSDTNPKTILLSPTEVTLTREAKAAVDHIFPGMLVERVEDGHLEHPDNGTRQPHSTAGAIAQLSWAIEYRQTGKGIDDEYEEGDNMIEVVCRQGEHIYAFLDAGEACASGGDDSWLSSAGNGFLRVARIGDWVVAQAKEAVNNGAGASPVRFKVEVVTGPSPAS